jgi:chromosome segregation ATPase
MDDRENERLRRLEERIDQLSEALLDTQDQLIEERSRNSALKLVLFTVVSTLILNNKLKLGEVLKALADAERQADPTDPVRAALAHELQELRSELGRLFAPAQASLSHGVLATLQRGLRRES